MEKLINGNVPKKLFLILI